MKHDRWGAVSLLSKFQLPSSNCLGGMMFLGSGGKSTLNNLISDKGVCRKAPATPGLLYIILLQVYEIQYYFNTILNNTILYHSMSTDKNTIIIHVLLIQYYNSCLKNKVLSYIFQYYIPYQNSFSTCFRLE